MPTYKNKADENSELLGLWLDGQLSEQQRQQFEQRCVDDPLFAEQVEVANMMNVKAESYQPQNVPHWDRSSTFDGLEKDKWWRWQGLSSLSFAVSMLAIVMVLSGMQVRMDDGAMTISFAAKQSSKEIDRLVADKLGEFQKNQQLVLSNYTQTMQLQQLDASTQLTSYLLNSNRQERREDFAELIKFVNEQRSDDQTFYARQLNKLQQDIYTNPGSLGLDNINE
ncbi:MAG: hypothetical protein ACI808_002850 [Paraglaciecola sp.]|jgi:hypothetical protein